MYQQSQLGHAVKKEDFKDAATLKVAIAAAARNDTVGRVMSLLNVRSLPCSFSSKGKSHLCAALISDFVSVHLLTAESHRRRTL